MDSKLPFQALDYMAIAASLLVAAGIGLWFRFSGNRQETPEEYLLAGKSMSKIPVVFSFAVTIMSAVSMLGGPAEVYRYGAGPFNSYLPIAVGMVLATYVVLPAYFDSGVSSIYEYLELRYGKITRYTVSALFIIQIVMYMSAVLYGPALALSAVTDFSLEVSIVVFALVCTFYCSIGGMKAVLWTDVFQAMLMFVSLAAIYGLAVHEVGGFSEAIRRAEAGGRLHILNTKMDLHTRQTVWNVGTMGLIMGLGSYGTNQLQVQRLLSLSSLKRAQSAFLWSIVPVLILIFLCDFLGVLLYAVFYTCDPVSDSHSGVKKYDQLVPYFVVNRLSGWWGAAGLCVAGIFSGSLSTVSSAINSLSTVTVVDFVQPFFALSQGRLVLVAKGLAAAYGLCCIGLAFVLSRADSLMQATLTSLSATEAPVCALFLVGILTSGPTEVDALVGLFIGCFVSGLIGYGSLFSGYHYPSLSFNTSQCLSKEYSMSLNLNNTEPLDNANNDDVFYLFKTSFMWMHAIGSSTTAIVIILPCIIRGLKKKFYTRLYMAPSSIHFWNSEKKTEVTTKFDEKKLQVVLENSQHPSSC